jgi:hypothetical protein
MNIQWSVVWSVLRTLLVAGGPVATLLIALGFPPVEVSTWLGIGLAAVGILSVLVPGIIGAITHTDKSKIAAAAAIPDVAKVEVAPSAKPSIAALAEDEKLPKVVKPE